MKTDGETHSQTLGKEREKERVLIDDVHQVSCLELWEPYRRTVRRQEGARDMGDTGRTKSTDFN